LLSGLSSDTVGSCGLREYLEREQRSILHYDHP
jgi:hypothetical protein